MCIIFTSYTIISNFFKVSSPKSMKRLSRLFTAPVGISARETTILSVRKGGKVVVMGDSQVTLGQSIVAKSTAKKLRRIHDDKVIVGFAGSTADAMSLLDKLDSKLKDYPELLRACVELAKEWRTDKALRRLEASLIVSDRTQTLEVDGQGNVIQPEDDIVAIGSGGVYAKAAARALIDIDGFDAEAIAEKAMRIATDIDVFSNNIWSKEFITNTDEAKVA